MKARKFAQQTLVMTIKTMNLKKNGLGNFHF